MGDVDHIPVRDTNIGGLEQRAAQQRRMVSKWSRDEIEDKYLRLSEENIILKKYARKQEDKIKRSKRYTRCTNGRYIATTMKSVKSDTMFGDDPPKDSDEESIDEEITEELTPGTSLGESLAMQEFSTKQETEEEESETPPVESDSEGLVMAPRPSKRRQKAEAKPGNSVTIAVNHVSLEEESSAMNNNHIKQLFIEYRFLGINPQETETPFSMPKPKPYHNIQFNFSNTFHVDLKNNYQRRQYLASMLLPSDPDDGKIRFTLVSEPPEDDQDGDCEDVGVAFVSIRDILINRKDVIDQEIEILDVQDEKTVIGAMNLTVACLSALESVEKEMKVEGTY